MALKIYANDLFDRAAQSGTFGLPPIGGAYTITGASGASVTTNGTNGTIVLTSATQSVEAALPNAALRDMDVYVKFAVGTTISGTGATATAVVRGRVQADGSCYEAQLLLHGASMVVQVGRRSATGAFTQIGTSYVLGVPYGVNQHWWMRFKVVSMTASSTQIAAKVWDDYSLEPARWHAQFGDTQATLQTSGYAAVGFAQTNQAQLVQRFEIYAVQVTDWNPDTLAPAVIDNLQAKPTSFVGLAELTWADSADTHWNYLVRESRDAQTWTRKAILGRNQTRYAVGVQGAYRLYWQIQARNPAGTSQSQIVSATPLPPVAPGNMLQGTVQRTVPVTIALRWGAAPANTHTWVLETQVSEFEWAEIDRMPSTTRFWNRTYPTGVYGQFNFRLRAENDGGLSAPSNEWTQFLPPPPGRALNVHAVYQGTTPSTGTAAPTRRRVSVDWAFVATDVPSIDAVHLERRLTNGEQEGRLTAGGWERIAPNLPKTQTDYHDAVPSPGVWVYRIVTENATAITISMETPNVSVPAERMILRLRAVTVDRDTFGNPVPIYRITDLDGHEYSLLRDGWVPKKTKRRSDTMGNVMPYSEVDEELRFNTTGARAEESYALMRAVDTMLDGVDKRYPDLVILEYQPKGSVLPSPLRARVVARPEASALSKHFGRAGTVGEIGDTAIQLRRRGVWTAPGAYASGVQAFVDPPLVAGAIMPRHDLLSPMSIDLGMGSPGELPTIPPSVVLIANDPHAIQLIHTGTTVLSFGAPGFSVMPDTGSLAYGGSVLRYTPTTTQTVLSSEITLPGAWRGRTWGVFAAVRVNGSSTYLMRAVANNRGRVAASDLETIEPGSGCKIVSLGRLVLDQPVQSTLRIELTAMAASGSLDMNYIALIALDNEVNRDLVIPQAVPISAAFPLSDVPLHLSIRHDPQAWRPEVVATSDEYDSAVAVPMRGDKALMHQGTQVAAAWLACAANGTHWRPTVNGTTITQSWLRARRFNAYISPE